jgi:hypothetical protein
VWRYPESDMVFVAGRDLEFTIQAGLNHCKLYASRGSTLGRHVCIARARDSMVLSYTYILSKIATTSRFKVKVLVSLWLTSKCFNLEAAVGPLVAATLQE